jgi:alpha-L-fucosidase
MSRISYFLAVLSLSFSSISLSPTHAEEASADQRMEWWHDAKFGMFIHWGVYAVPAGVYDGKPVEFLGEWIMRQAQIPVSTYKSYAKQFNPTKYDPAAWADLAKQAGMKYVVITSKHHDGFALYDSAVTDWDIADASPYGKDVLTPLAEAVRGRGLKFGLYYSQAQDWNHPGGAKAGYEEGDGWDEAHKGDYDAYLKKIAIPQTGEILARFKPDVLWWDTPVWMTPERAKPLHELLAAYPNIITNDRLGGGYSGDTKTPEQYIPATPLPGNWETCMTLNDTWGFKSTDHNWKTPETLIRNLVDIVSKGGNYLLNVGPTAEGEISPESIELLQAVGKWMAVNDTAIYGTTPIACRAPRWGRLTQKGNQVFVLVFDWPADGKLSVPINAAVEDCRLLAEPSRKFNTTAHENGLDIQLSGTAPDKICSVIVLDVAGNVEGIIPRVPQAVDGTLELSAIDATLQGNQVRVEQIADENNIGYWTDANDNVQWNCKLSKGGEFAVVAEVAAPLESRFNVQAGDSQVPAKVTPTGGFDKFQTIELGRVNLPQAGNVTVSVRPEPGNWQAINLRRLVLRPVQ